LKIGPDWIGLLDGIIRIDGCRLKLPITPEETGALSEEKTSAGITLPVLQERLGVDADTKALVWPGAKAAFISRRIGSISCLPFMHSPTAAS
jgi:hypothetical protein